MLYVRVNCTLVYKTALRKYDFREQWSVTPKNRGQSKKIQGWTAVKSRGRGEALGGEALGL